MIASVNSLFLNGYWDKPSFCVCIKLIKEFEKEEWPYENVAVLILPQAAV